MFNKYNKILLFITNCKFMGGFVLIFILSRRIIVV